MKLTAALLMLALGQIFAQINYLTTVNLPSGSGNFMVANLGQNELYISGNPVTVIDTTSWSIKNSLQQPLRVANLCVSPSGTLAITTLSSKVVITNPTDGSSQILDAGISNTIGCSFSIDSQRLFISSDLRESPGQKKLSVLDTNTWAVIQTWAVDEESLPTLQALPNGKVYVLGQYGPTATGDLKVLDGGSIKKVDIRMYPMTMSLATNKGRVYVYVNGIGKNTNGQSISTTVVVDTDSDKVINWSAPGSTFMSFPSDDPWFFYTSSPSGDISGINIAQKQTVMSRPADQPTLGMSAHRQADGSDVIALLQNSQLGVFTATQPPMLYAITNGASFETGPVAPGEIVSLFGAKLGTETVSFSTTPLPTQLASVSVMVNGREPLSLYFVSPGQINVQIPYDLLNNYGGHVGFQVVTSSSNTNIVTMPLAQTAPAPFAGPNSEVLVDLTGHWTKASAVAGQVAMIFATGLGQVSPAVPTGSPAPSSPLSTVVGTTTVNLCGQPAQVLFSGLAPTYVGLYQINIQVPQECSTAPENMTIEVH